MIPGSPYEVLNGVPFSKFKGFNGSSLYLVNTMEEWKAFYGLLMKKKLVACDTETTGFRYYAGDKIIGMSFGWGLDHFYIPVRHNDSVSCGKQLPQLSMDDIRDDLRIFFSQRDVFTIWSNGKFDRHFYRADGIEITTPFHDTIFLWKFWDEDAPAALKTVASGWTDLMGRKHEGIIGPEANKHEKEIGKWRTEENKARKMAFNKAVIEKTDELRKDMRYQHLNRTQLKKYIKENILNTHQYAKTKKEHINYSFIPIEMMVQYAATDTFLTWTLYEFLMKNLKLSDKLKELYINELQLSLALFDAEEGGVKIDRPYLIELGKKYAKDIQELQKKIIDQLTGKKIAIEQISYVSELDAIVEDNDSRPDDSESGGAAEALAKESGISVELAEVLTKGEDAQLNLNSTQQLAKALIDVFGVPLTEKTEAGNWVLDKPLLEELAPDYPIIDDILKLRKILKLKSTYVDSILEKLVGDDILHCSYNQNVSTGRMSSQDPNLNNIPGKDDAIRKAFINQSDDYYYFLIDYSQVEVRLTAHYSNDPILVNAYRTGEDIHSRTTCQMFGYDYIDLEAGKDDKNHPRHKEYSEMRKVGKVLNFAVIYSVSESGLAQQVPRPAEFKNAPKPVWIARCGKFITEYLDAYLGVRRFMNQYKRVVRKDAQIETHFGRIRHLPHAHATKILKDKSKYWMEARAERQGVNALIQGTAADMFKMAIVRIHKILRGSKSRMVNFVHDEIQLYIHKDDIHLVPKIKAAMEDFQFNVPIVADVSYTKTNWADKKKYIEGNEL